jgi:replicative DNA helicase
MTSHAEDVIFANLSDGRALEAMIREGLDISTMPTEAARPIVEWVMEEYYRTGRISAPSTATIREMWRDVLDDNEISLGDGTETEPVETAISTLKSQHALFRVQAFQKTLARAMSDADPVDYTAIVDRHAAEFVDLSLLLARKAGITNGSTAVDDALRRYADREREGHQTIGMTFGIPEIDAHTFGIHPGELAVLAAGPKVGKSWFCAMVALHEAYMRRTTVLYTLENTTEMTWDRLICMAAKVPYRDFQRGTLSEADMEKIVNFFEFFSEAKSYLHIINPEMGKRTVQHMVREAQVREVQSLIIDQLTFIDTVKASSRWEAMREITHELKALISTGRERIPCLLAHQINREGVKQAEKAKTLEMHHLAEGSEVERTADWVFGLYQTAVMREAQEVRFQILAARREDTKDWLMTWRPMVGLVQVQTEYVKDDE